MHACELHSQAAIVDRRWNMAQKSAGILLYRLTGGAPELFLVHPGGPFWANKDDGAWSIPKGLYEDGEDPFAAARREFQEETGIALAGTFAALGDFRQPSGKIISAWAVEGDCAADAIASNLFTMEWPPKSGRQQEFPEVDRAAWFAVEEALRKISKGQRPIVERFVALTGYDLAGR
jgi:predicted NUDIX family NTP pyrophosphohydrolase